jgi:hypothetical protein
MKSRQNFPMAIPPFAPNLGGADMQSRNMLSLANVLKNYSKQHVIALAAGMLTVPKFQANCYRLEILIHLAVANCSGKTKPTRQHIMNWLNRQLGDHAALMEDPVEDVFVTNVVTKRGAFRILGGTWEMPDLSTNILLQCIKWPPLSRQLKP